MLLACFFNVRGTSISIKQVKDSKETAEIQARYLVTSLTHNRETKIIKAVFGAQSTHLGRVVI